MKKLLDTYNYRLIRMDNTKYVFLTESQQVLEITNDKMDRYFMICEGKRAATSQDEVSVRMITEAINSTRRLPQPQKPSKQQMLTINTTHGCNMACKYCFASTKRERENVMSLSVVKKAIINMVENNREAESYTIYFFGGEPLLHKQFVKDATALAKEEIVAKRGKKVKFALNTNGTLIDAASVEFFKKENFTITVSIDGPEQDNDINRIFLNGRGTFDRIMKGITALKDGGVNFNLRATFNPKARCLVNTFKFFEDLKVPYTYAFAINSKERDEQETHFSNSDIDRFDKELEAATEYLVKKAVDGEKVYCSGFLQKISRIKHRTMRSHGCEAGRGTLIVDEEGHYYACQNMLPLKEAAIGDINKGLNVDKLQKYQAKDLSQLLACQTCWARYLCGGGCEAERYFPDKNESEFSQRCRLMQLEWMHFIRAYIRINDLINNKFNIKKSFKNERIERVGA